jgi:hypothetical protein
VAVADGGVQADQPVAVFPGLQNCVELHQVLAEGYLKHPVL